MAASTLAVSQGAKSHSLNPGANQVRLTEGLALVRVTGSQHSLFFNGVPVPLQRISDDIRVGQLDLRNKVGCHRLSLTRAAASSIHFDFATDTAKATWLEIQSMVEKTREFAIGSGRPFLYLGQDGIAAVSSPEQLIYWLRDRIDEVEHLCQSINKSPAARLLPRLRNSTQARGIDLRATAALIRERPSLLEESPKGGVTVGGKSFWPSMVRVRATSSAIPDLEHRQIRTFLRQLGDACQASSLLYPEAIPLGRKLAALTGLRNINAPIVGATDALPSAQPSPIQRRDPRYARIRQLSIEFRFRFSLFKQANVSVRADIKDVWEIYQSFAAHMVGRALNLQYVSERAYLRDRDANGASMIGGDLRLSYDVIADSPRLTSWRSSTVRPALERPDIVVENTSTGKLIIIDVKFSIDREGRCRAEHDFEMQGYLNSFSLTAGGIIFPGNEGASRNVTDGAFLISEIPLRANDSFKVEALQACLDGLWC